ncbi:MAG: dTMP kinase [Candidatus ainarchaeum sp.]|nr:dTMP kinase [Candidatus ainarchaeum sp.]
MRKGKLIAFEGIDGCGKETQISLIKSEHPDILIFKYPSKKTPLLGKYLAKKIELSGKKLLKLFLNDIKRDQKIIEKALYLGKNIILDRYIFSTLAYEKPGISFKEAKRIIREYEFLKPDMVFLLDISPEISQKRKRSQKKLDRYESNIQYLTKVRKNFLLIYKDKFMCKKWIKIDTKNSIPYVNTKIEKMLKNL